MVLNEQKYCKKITTYYHGSKRNIDKLEAREMSEGGRKVLYVTKSPFYAYKNYTGENGFLFELKFTKPLNIFNANHSVDIFRLKKIMNLSGNEILSMQIQDWFVFDMTSGRNIRNKEHLIDKFFRLGYDGFYNKENAKGSFYFDGIGLFSNDSIKIINKYSKSEAEEYIEEIKKNIESEKKKEMVEEYLKSEGSSSEILKEIFKKDRRELEHLTEEGWKVLLSSIKEKLG
jgi:hypothetical protein